MSRAYNILFSVFAFMLWGGWAFYINNASENSIVSALLQGVASMIITLMLVRLVSFIYRYLAESSWRFILPSVISVSITGSGLMLMHLLAGTSRILLTIMPALIIAFLFCIYTTLKLQQMATYNEE